MRRENNSETNSTETDDDDDDSILTAAELAEMGWPNDIKGVDTGVDRVHLISNSLSDTKILDQTEAQALAFREIADVGRQRTADETGMFLSEVDRELSSAQQKVTDAQAVIEILDQCGH